MPTQNQLAKIHIAKKDLNISEVNYREALSGFGVESSKHLSESDADKFIEALKKIGFVPKPSKKTVPIKITVPENRPPEFASQAQINMLAGMWVQHSRVKTKESLMKFIMRLAEINAIEWLQKDRVQKIKRAIEELK